MTSEVCKSIMHFIVSEVPQNGQTFPISYHQSFIGSLFWVAGDWVSCLLLCWSTFRPGTCTSVSTNLLPPVSTEYQSTPIFEIKTVAYYDKCPDFCSRISSDIYQSHHLKIKQLAHYWKSSRSISNATESKV